MPGLVEAAERKLAELGGVNRASVRTNLRGPEGRPSGPHAARLSRWPRRGRATARELSRFKFITDHVSDWILLLNGSGDIHYANVQACSDLGWTARQLAGRKLESLVREEQRPVLRDDGLRRAMGGVCLRERLVRHVHLSLQLVEQRIAEHLPPVPADDAVPRLRLLPSVGAREVGGRQLLPGRGVRRRGGRARVLRRQIAPGDEKGRERSQEKARSAHGAGSAAAASARL